jgi:hypothetical protein
MVISFGVGLNSGEKTFNTGVDPVLIREGFADLSWGEALGEQGFDNLFE